MDSDDELIVIPENTCFKTLKRDQPIKVQNNRPQMSLFSILSSIDEKTVFKNYAWPAMKLDHKEEPKESVYAL